MIPIECPKCGRGGSVPPDRLNARLVCKACHTVFHLDNTGRMVMGEPESFDMKSSKSRGDEPSSLADFDFAQTWNDIPAPVKYGVPAALLAVVIYLNVGSFGGSPDYFSRASSLISAVISNNKSKVVSMSSTDSAEAAGQWFDMIRAEVEKNQIGSDATINPALLNGVPDKDANLTLMVVVSKAGSTDAPLTYTLPMKRDGSNWVLDATQGLELAQKAAATTPPPTPKK
jgi:hypothetical protein